jgi:RHS repeat-associated protein
VAADAKGFIGERFDPDAGLQYLNARYYDPELGLFIQPDWFEVTQPGVGTNRYSYSFNDPVNLSDRSGNCVWDLCIGEGYATVALVTAIVAVLAVDHAVDISDNGAVDGSSLLGNPTGMVVVGGVQLIEGMATEPAGVGHNGGPELEPEPDDNRNQYQPPDPEDVLAAALAAGVSSGLSSDVRDILEENGYNGNPTTQTTESGTLYENISTPNGDVDVCVMDGAASSNPLRGPRVITTRPGTTTQRERMGLDLPTMSRSHNDAKNLIHT